MFLHRVHVVTVLAVCLLGTQARAANPIQTENALPGTNAWQLTNPAANREIEGYASLASVAQGSQISFFVSTSDPSYTLEVYRMGWYAGNGARLLTSTTLSGRLQPTPAADPTTGLIECNWTQSLALQIPASWVSGAYLVKLTGSSSGKQSYIVFVVREDSRASALLFDSSVSTFQAYNNWPYPSAGGKSLYGFNSSTGAAVKVSFNRPYAIDTLSQYFPLVGSGFFLRWEYSMIRFLEKSGYDVTYASSVDLHENSAITSNHKGLLLVGHDEYWSWQMRANVIAARDAGVNLGFFASNVCFWQIRFENSPVTGGIDRVVVGYKTSSGNDPVTNKCYVTNLWRQNTCVASEESFIGVEYIEDPVNTDLIVFDQSSWVLAGTGLTNGAVLPGLVGYEADGELAGNSPPGTSIIMHSPIPALNSDAQAYPYSDMVTYTTSGGATVFATGSMQFTWGLDNYGAPSQHAAVANSAAQTLTANVLARLSMSGTSSSGGAPVSDDFTGTTLNTSLWTFINPVGDGSYALSNGDLRLTVPAGTVHDIWTTGDNSARVMQPISNADFEVAVKFDSAVTSLSQMQGIIVEQDSSTFLRFDFRNDGNSPRLFAASIAGGAGTFQVDIPLSSSIAPPLWLKVKRTANTWTESWSTDGVNYTTGGSFNYTLTTNRIGPFAGNYGNPASAAPAMTAAVDYFYNTATIPTGPDLTVTKSHSGNFTAGGTGSYTITARNSGTGPTTGTVTVTDTLPTGLTATSFSSTGWTCTVSPTVSCSRSDSLAAGASFPALTLTVSVASNAPASVTNTVTVSGGGESNTANDTASDVTAIGTSSSGGAPVSDDFNGTTLNTSLWTFVNPIGNGSYSVTGGDLRLTVPAGTVHDIWTTGDNSARVMQPISNADFEVAVKFDSAVTSLSQMQGIIVEQDSSTFLRFDFRNDGNSPRLFAASIAGAAGTFQVDIPLSSSIAPPLWLKVKRTANTWTESWSTDGVNYTTGGSFNYTLTTNRIGPFAGNYGNPASAAPAMTAAVDYFYNTATIPTGPDLTVTKSHSGNFTAGGTGSYTITARNSGTGPTTGAVTVTDTLPASLTATSFSSSSGWTCTVSPTVSCSRSDSLAAGASFPALTLTVSVASNAPASVTNTVTVSGGGESNTANDTASDVTAIGTSSSGGAPVSDDFNGTALNTSLWTFINPVGDGSYTLSNGELRLTVPAGIVHDIWTTGDNSARVMQPISNADFEVAVKFDSAVTSLSQMQGIIVEQDSSTFLRFDFRNDGNSPRLFAASIAGGTGTFQVDIPLSSSIAPPLWLKVKRTANTWTESWSTDGVNYTTGGSFNYTLTTNRIGPFAGNYGNPASAAPAMTAAVDYFYNTATIPTGPDLTVTKSHSGNFTAGGTGSYTITARNSGTGPTTGTVTVTDTLPAGLTATSFSSTGWTCTVSPTVSCSRSDSLAAGASFPALTLTVSVASNAPASVTNTVTVSGGGESNTANDTASDVTAIGTSSSGGAPVSDDFNGTALNTSLWTFVNPIGNGSYSVTGGDLRLTVPAGTVHDIWTTGDNSARVMQPISNADFQLAVKFDSAVTSLSQMQGIIVEQDSSTFLRFDFRNDGNSPRLFAASIAGGAGTFLIDIPLSTSIAPPLWLKVKRTANTWTESWSTDGVNYTTGGSFNYTLTTNRIGPFAGNYGNPASAAPAMTAAVDYFYNILQ